jgi:hypothetical protein
MMVDLKKTAEQTIQNLKRGVASAKKATADGTIFYHCYVCPSIACLKSSNPIPGSLHQRGMHLATNKPRTDVRCPGCGEKMVIARNGLTGELKDGNPIPHPEGHITTDRDDNAIFHGEPLIHEAPGQEDMSDVIDQENADAEDSQ